MPMPLTPIAVPAHYRYRAYAVSSHDPRVAIPSARSRIRAEAREAGEFAHFIDYLAPCACEDDITFILIYQSRPGWWRRLVAYVRHRPKRGCCCV